MRSLSVKLHATLHDPHGKTVDIVAMKQEIDSIKTHFAIKSDVIRWTVGVGAVSVISIIGVLATLDARMTHMDTRLTQEIRDLRKETHEGQKELRQEMRQMSAELSKKIDALRR
jgi:hypothetical protein